MKDRGHPVLPGMEEYSLTERVQQAITLLCDNEPPEGYYFPYSGGKDSGAVEKLLKLAGVKYEAHYNNTTIDPPELVRFIKQTHPEVPWNISPHGHMLHRIAETAPKTAPTRQGRWCCEEYKEYGGDGRTKVMGVRKQESRTRAMNWREKALDRNGRDIVICPVVFWTAETVVERDGTVLLLGDIWDFHREYKIPYCSLYDEGLDRIGCVGCMLQSSRKQAAEFRRWPRYREAWKRAIIRNWERLKDVPNTKTGGPRYHAKFRDGEDYWQWWLTSRAPDYFREDCMSGLLYTNPDDAETEGAQQ